MREIERKFIVKQLPANVIDCPRFEIEQGYLARDANGTQVRLRRSNSDCCLTIKNGQGTRREEYNLPLAREQFDALWALTAGRRLRKTRYDVPHRGAIIEIDVYHGRNEGLIVAEVEFPDDHACTQFEPPPWLGEEISGKPAFGNVHLATE